MRKLGFGVVGAVLALVLVANCGGDVGQWLVDAGFEIGDGGLIDVASADAVPGDPTAFTCEKSIIWTTTMPGNYVQTYQQWYAEIDAPGLERKSDVRVTMCSPQCYGSTCTPPVTTCPPGATCTAEGEIPADGECLTYNGSFDAGGRVVVYCGYRVVTNYVSPATPDSEIGLRRTEGFLFVN